ncbi:hypothetical protein Ocin01_15895 [Orchesella cincta]|uniref:CHK kinase-like domain-containing protein n=1 Tax=Orchesella cincta TaxID=48709 RepID=A0A1D2MCR2_ORCCI|nr:hypothetical protein Ocin01_15895 [Orchesella cincta]
MDPIQEKIAKRCKEVLKSHPELKNKDFDVTVQSSGSNGDGMVSQTHNATVTFKSVGKEPLQLFVKTKTTNEVHNVMVDDIKAFEKEAVFYMKYVPAARKFLKSKLEEELLDNIYPKCYFADDKITIFENLFLKGYRLGDREEKQSLEEAKIALSTLAQHHAISFALIKEYKGPIEFFKKFENLDFECYFTDQARGSLEPLMENGISACITMLEKNPGEGTKETIASLGTMKGKTYEMVLESLEADPNDPLLVLNHGDYYNNNMMFLKDQEKSEVIGHRALDLQLTRYISPVVDISYYIFTSVKPDVRRNNLEELFEWYLEQLNSTSASLNYPIDMSYEDLFQAFRKRFKFGFWVGLALSAAPGYAVFKDVDTSDETCSMPEQLNKLLLNWIEKNPVKVTEMSKNIVKLIEEFNKLDTRSKTG